MSNQKQINMRTAKLQIEIEGSDEMDQESIDEIAERVKDALERESNSGNGLFPEEEEAFPTTITVKTEDGEEKANSDLMKGFTH